MPKNIDLRYITLLKDYVKNECEETTQKLIEYFDEKFLIGYLSKRKKECIKDNYNLNTIATINDNFEEMHQQAILVFIENIKECIREERLPLFNDVCLVVSSEINKFFAENFDEKKDLMYGQDLIDYETPEKKHIMTESLLCALSLLSSKEIMILKLYIKHLSFQQIEEIVGLEVGEASDTVKQIQKRIEIKLN